MRAKIYRIYQAPPPAHWYQRRIGWFGKAFAGSLLVMVAVGAVVGNQMTQDKVKTLAAQSSQESLEKVTTSPLAEPTAENIVDLQFVIDKWADDHPGQKWGVVAKSLEGPSFNASSNADSEFQSASIYKLFLTLPLFNQIPTEHQKGISVNVNNSQRSVATCVDLMLRTSDNECGEAVGDYVNWQKADKVLKEKGFNHTVFGESSYLRTSPSDTATFLEGLYGNMFNRTARDSIMASLKQQRWRDGIPSGCPGCTVANKTGSIDNVMHDAAVIEYSGGSYVLVIFSEGGSFKQIAELTGRIQQKILDTTL